ncbi:MAG TPA: hypothetical protein VIU15_05185, partial [Streptomyces sp.]
MTAVTDHQEHEQGPTDEPREEDGCENALPRGDENAKGDENTGGDESDIFDQAESAQSETSAKAAKNADDDPAAPDDTPWGDGLIARRVTAPGTEPPTPE